MLDGYSKDQLLTIANKIWRRTYRDMGGAFDAPTFRIVFPRRHALYCDIARRVNA